jgi:elongation factor Ts
MSEITAQMVKDLRERTGAGMMDCKKALSESAGDMERAIEILRKKGLKNIERRAERVAAEGLIYCYIHPGGKIGVLLELNCETDFVSRNEDFAALAKGIAMHVAWSNPRYLSRTDVPSGVLETEKEIYRSQIKPEQQHVADKIIGGKLDKFYETVCLLEQFDAREQLSKKRIIDLVNEVSAKIGEKIVVRRFVRYEVGEGIERPQSDFAAEVARAALS